MFVGQILHVRLYLPLILTIEEQEYPLNGSLLYLVCGSSVSDIITFFYHHSNKVFSKDNTAEYIILTRYIYYKL